MDRCCATCKFYWEDRSVNDCDCLIADNMTTDEWETYFVDEAQPCPYWKPYMTEEEIKAEDDYYASLVAFN